MNGASNTNVDMEQSEAGRGGSSSQAYASHAGGTTPSRKAALDAGPDTSDGMKNREESLPENAAADHSTPKSPRSFTFKVGTKRPFDETSPTATEYSSPPRKRLPGKPTKLLPRDLLPHEVKLAHILYRRHTVSRFLPAAVALKYWIHYWKQSRRERGKEWEELLELHETPSQKRERLRVTAFHESATSKLDTPAVLDKTSR
ncbi:hypothetical protein LZ554_007978 [Drepanopeziza brunnea f. sp. 'monogermtubi']|nr:hypothetical protein LZ554_007978 [Drepanopeziza brunnea f. sp. 'monogermtubi']